MTYGKDFDFTQAFFPQFDALLKVVPLPAVQTRQNENCPYVNSCGFTKDSYLSFNTDFSEDCYYCNNALRSKYCFNVFNAEECERCYDCYDIKRSEKIFFSNNIISSHALYFSQNCVGCSFCFGCKNLVNKQYCVFNKQVTKEEFDTIVATYLNGTQSQCTAAQQQANDFHKTLPNKALELENTEKAYGHNLVNANNCTIVFDGANLENVSYSTVINGTKTTRDFDFGGYNCELCVENVS